MQLNPALLSDARILAAYIIFFASYFVFALGKFPGMKIDRPGAAPPACGPLGFCRMYCRPSNEGGSSVS